MTTEWEKDGDPCNDCGEPTNYSEATGWYFHVDPNAPACFLAESGEPKDVSSSASRQHWIETGTYLREGEAIQADDGFLRRADGSIYGRRSPRPTEYGGVKFTG